MNEGNTGHARNDVVALTEGYCNGTLEGEGLAQLEEILLHDAEARAYFRRYLGLDAALREHGESAAEHWFPALKGPPVKGLSRESDSSTSAEELENSGTPVNAIRSASRPWFISRLWHRNHKIRIAALYGVALLGVAAILGVILNHQEASTVAIGTLEQVTGDVRIMAADGQVRVTAPVGSIGQGDTVRTRGSESSAVVAHLDGTRLTLAGDTSVTYGDHRSKSIVVHQGNLAASVKPQPAEKPLLLTTPSAQLQVVGTRFQIETLENRTDLSVTEGRVRLVRLRDQQSVEVPDGKYATVTERNQLLVKDIPSLPATWEQDFEAGLPEGWDRGEWVTEGLPPGSRGAVKATWGEGNSGANYSIRSNAPWLQGLFAVQKNSHIHFTFKTERREWINIFIVTRTAGSDTARYSGNYLLEDFPKEGSGEWETVSIPLTKFKRIHSGAESLVDLVPFKLMFVFDGPDRGLVIDRVWVTPDRSDSGRPANSAPPVGLEERR